MMIPRLRLTRLEQAYKRGHPGPRLLTREDLAALPDAVLEQVQGPMTTVSDLLGGRLPTTVEDWDRVPLSLQAELQAAVHAIQVAAERRRPLQGARARR